MADATVNVRILDRPEFSSVVAVAQAAVQFMKWAAPLCMEDAQWDAWSRLEKAVSELGKSFGIGEIPQS